MKLGLYCDGCSKKRKFCKCNVAPSLAILTPMRDRLTPETEVALRRNVEVPFVHLTEIGRPVAEARNTLVARALALDPRPEWTLWVDADAWWPAGTISRMKAALSRSNADVLFGFFCVRQEFASSTAWRNYFSSLRSKVALGVNGVLPGDVVPVDVCGFHCVLMPTSILERMSRYRFSFLRNDDGAPELGEDEIWCLFAMDEGLLLAVDTGSPIEHIAPGGEAYQPCANVGRIIDNRLVRRRIVSIDDLRMTAPALQLRAYDADIHAISGEYIQLPRSIRVTGSPLLRSRTIAS